jgi:hypothetical protein
LRDTSRRVNEALIEPEKARTDVSDVANDISDKKGGTNFEFCLLNAVAVIWGSQHVVIKSMLNSTSAATLNFWRFFLSASIFLPALVQVVVSAL